jgi:hypothetical protein
MNYPVLGRDVKRREYLVIKVTKIEVQSVEGTVIISVFCS